MIPEGHLKTWATGAAVSVLTLLAGGCACPTAPRARISTDTASARPSNAIFNPGPYVIPPLVHESPWPATFAARPEYDDTYFRISIWDHQGRANSEHDYHRRVYSVQEGLIQR